MATLNKNYISSNRWIYFAIFLFMIIILFTTWLYYQNNILEEKAKFLNKEIKDREIILKTLKQNDVLQVFSLLKSNINTFKKQEKLSNIPVLINKIKELESEYNLIFTNFSYSKWIVNLKVESDQQDLWDDLASQKVTNFIWDFRTKIIKEESGEKRTIKAQKEEFELDFIKSFSWNKKIGFNIILKINLSKYELEKKEKIEEILGVKTVTSIEEKIKAQNEKIKENKVEEIKK